MTIRGRSALHPPYEGWCALRGFPGINEPKTMSEERMTAARMEACKLSSSEIHNMRMKSLDYVRDDLTRLNESRVLERISDRMRGIRELYLKTFGQRMQPSAQPLQEVVLIIDDGTTMDEVVRFGELCREAYGITPIQYHIHRDEGHYEDKAGRSGWRPNLHAHIVFDVICYEHRMERKIKKSHGKAVKDDRGRNVYIERDTFCNTFKFNKQHLSLMQDLAAAATGMKRGVPSDKRHYTAEQYKMIALLDEIEANMGLNEEVKRRIKEGRDTLSEIEGKVRSAEAEAEDIRKDMAKMAADIGEAEATLSLRKEEISEVSRDLQAMRREANGRRIVNGITGIIANATEAIEVVTKTGRYGRMLKAKNDEIEGYQHQLFEKEMEVYEAMDKAAEERRESASTIEAIRESLKADRWRYFEEIERQKNEVERQKEEVKRLQDKIADLSEAHRLEMDAVMERSRMIEGMIFEVWPGSLESVKIIINASTRPGRGSLTADEAITIHRTLGEDKAVEERKRLGKALVDIASDHVGNVPQQWIRFVLDVIMIIAEVGLSYLAGEIRRGIGRGM